MMTGTPRTVGLAFECQPVRDDQGRVVHRTQVVATKPVTVFGIRQTDGPPPDPRRRHETALLTGQTLAGLWPLNATSLIHSTGQRIVGAAVVIFRTTLRSMSITESALDALQTDHRLQTHPMRWKGTIHDAISSETAPGRTAVGAPAITR